MKITLSFVAAFVFVHGIVVFAQAGQTNNRTASSANPGSEMFRTFCASCHGADGTGSGPVSKTLKSPMPDLTTISRRNNGEFPEAKVMRIIDGQDVLLSHGTRDMPIWGEVLPSDQGPRGVMLRERTLTDYIKSIQK